MPILSRAPWSRSGRRIWPPSVETRKLDRSADARAVEALSEADPQLAHDPLRVLSQHTPCTHKGAGEGLRPFDPEGRPRSAAACVLAHRASRVRSRPMEPGQAAPLALNGACRRGPRSPPRHRRSPRPRRRRACGRHDGEVVRGERTGDAVRDGGTHRSLPRQRRRKLGVQGGRSVPLARPQCFTYVGWLTHLSVRLRWRDGSRKRTRRGVVGPRRVHPL